MPNPTITIHNSQTDKITSREMNAEEFSQYKADQAKNAAEQVEAEATATQKAALLARLGITADEAKLLLGGN